MGHGSSSSSSSRATVRALRCDDDGDGKWQWQKVNKSLQIFAWVVQGARWRGGVGVKEKAGKEM